ncbi:MAG: trypsin-like peptidase domain-containing protein [Streptosporangiaceae bacterium]
MAGPGFTAVSLRTASRPRERPPQGWRLVAAVAALVLGCTVAGGVVGGYLATRISPSPLDRTYSLRPLPPAPASQADNSVAAVAAQDTPGVVMIKVDGGAGTGSGFIISGGYIVTNNHVVTLDGEAQGSSLQIDLSNGNTVAGQLVGSDPYSDIAVIRATGVSGLPALPLGNSASVAVGDPVIAIGSPLGLADTVTSGIVSALQRPVEPGAAGSAAPEAYFDAIQTDAPINPGNSGGPLVNAQGQVIGVDAALDTLGGDPLTGAQGGSIGLGFAIPVNQARRVIMQLIRTGYATHAVIGAALNGGYSGTGAQIATDGPAGHPAVTPGGPAAQAGLQPGDVITRLGSVPVDDADSLIDAVRSLPPWSRVEVSYVRQGSTLQTSLQLGSARS